MIGAFRKLLISVLACSLCFTLPVQASQPQVEKSGARDRGKRAAALERIANVRALEGVSLKRAIDEAISTEAFQDARGRLTAGRNMRPETGGAVAFTGRYGHAKVEVVLVPFPDAAEPENKAGMIALMRSGKRTVASYCVLERAALPSEPGASELDLGVEIEGGKSVWLWEGGSHGGRGSEGRYEANGDSQAGNYFKCVLRRASAGCAGCLGRCLLSITFFAVCMKTCCLAALAAASISCAVEMMFL